MKRKLLITICLTLTLLLTVFVEISKAENLIDIDFSKNEIAIEEKITLKIGISKPSAAGTVWIYFDNEKLECLTKNNNMNIIGNRIIYTWISENRTK